MQHAVWDRVAELFKRGMGAGVVQRGDNIRDGATHARNVTQAPFIHHAFGAVSPLGPEPSKSGAPETYAFGL